MSILICRFARRLMKSSFCVLCGLMLVFTSCAQPRATLIVWHSLDGARERALLKLIDRYNTESLHGTIIIPERRSPKAQHDAVLRGIETNALPGLLLASPKQAAIYNERGALQKIEKFADNADDDIGWNWTDKADLFPFVMNAGKTPAGEWIGVPFGGNARVMAVNSDWLRTQTLEAIPPDLDAFNRACELASSPVNNMFCFTAVPDETFLQEWLKMNDALFASPDGAIQIDNAETESALDKLSQMVFNGQAFASGSNDQIYSQFATGRIVFAFDWSSNLRGFVDAIAQRGTLNWDVIAPPSRVDRPTSIQRAPLWLIPKTNSDRETRAWKFAHWLLESRQTAQWSVETGELPARASAINELDATKLPKVYASLLRQVAPKTVVEPLVVTWECARESLDLGARGIFEGRVVSETMQETRRDAQTAMQEVCSER
jgi:ABC-type glycerol-3-phosphate transport system substrate-binding protein